MLQEDSLRAMHSARRCCYLHARGCQSWGKSYSVRVIFLFIVLVSTANIYCNRAVDEERDGNPPDSTLMRENISLKIRIRQLELALSRPELVKLDTGIPSATTMQQQQDSHSSESIVSDFQAHVFGLSVDSPAQGPVNQSSSWDSQVKLILPTRRWSDTIIEFSLTQFGWVHCALDEAAFIKEHNSFWKSLIDSEKDALRNHGWIAVYLSVLAVSLEISSTALHVFNCMSRLERIFSTTRPSIMCNCYMKASLPPRTPLSPRHSVVPGTQLH